MAINYWAVENALIASNDGFQVGKRCLKVKKRGAVSLEPEGIGNLYKCVSVDPASHTWSGCRVYPNDDGKTFSFDSAVTSPLFYSSVTPEIDKVYTADASSCMAFLYEKGWDREGLVLDACLYDMAEYTENGYRIIHSATTSGKINFAMRESVPCVYMSSNCIVYLTGIPWLSPGETFSLSYWGYNNQLALGTLTNTPAQSYIRIEGYITHSQVGYTTSVKGTVRTSLSTANIHHFVITYSNRSFNLYVDKNVVYSDTFDSNYKSTMTFGGGYVSGMRFFTRVLSMDELNMLYREFSPGA